MMTVSPAAEGASRALVNMSGHDKLSQPMKEDVFLCLCAGQRTRDTVLRTRVAAAAACLPFNSHCPLPL